MTTIRNIDRVLGTVFDLPHAMSLSDDNCNVLSVSDRTLFFIQLFGTGEIDFLSRYASQFLDGNRYVLADLPLEKDQINDIQNNYELEVQPVTNAIVDALNGIQQAILTTGSNACACGTVGETVDSDPGTQGGTPPEGFGEPDPAVIDRICKAANVIHQSIFQTITKLEASPAEEFLDLGFGLVAGIVSATIAAAFIPVAGILLVGVAGAVIGVTLALIATGINLASLKADLLTNAEELVCALVETTDATAARDAYLQVLIDAGVSLVNRLLIQAMMTNNVMNLLFFSTPDSEAFLLTYVVVNDCSGCGTLCLTAQPWADASGVGGSIVDLGGGAFEMTSAVRPDGCHGVGILFNANEMEGAQCGPMLQCQFQSGATTGYGGCSEFGVRVWEDQGAGWPDILRVHAGSIIWSSFIDTRTNYFVRDDGSFVLTVVTIAI